MTTREEIPRDTLVEHERSGQQGVVVAHSRPARGPVRHHVRWTNIEYETPGGVVADRLIIIKRAQS